MKELLQKKRAEGFTIIEVMIVLAIAGLIMVIVFIAVPQLQRNQRDNARQSIADRVKAEMETYAGNNQGQYPFNTTACVSTGSNVGKICDFVNRYIGTGTAPPSSCNPNNGKVNTCDPTTGQPVMTGADNTHGKPVNLSAGTSAVSGIQKGQMVVAYGAKCDGEGLAASGASDPSTRNYAVVIGLDRDGTDYCVDNG